MPIVYEKVGVASVLIFIFYFRDVREEAHCISEFSFPSTWPASATAWTPSQLSDLIFLLYIREEAPGSDLSGEIVSTD
jgi:hypothetical protein